jgi:ABC-type glutathione transport system ATPase component
VGNQPAESAHAEVASGCAMLLVSHDLDLARQTTHRQWHIEQGRLHMG